MNKKLLLILLSLFTLNFTFAQEEIIEIAEEPQEKPLVFTVVEEMPVFSEVCLAYDGDERYQCSMKKFQDYLTKVDYPQVAVDNDIVGKVYISFVVDKDGSVTEVFLLRGANKILDDAAMEHIKNTPDFFKPGYQRGKAVKVKYTVPIVFALTESTYKPLTKKEAKQLRKETRQKLRSLKKIKN